MSIAITTEPGAQKLAAISLSGHLNDMGCKHAYIASNWHYCNLTGNKYDIDVLIDSGTFDMKDLRARIAQSDPHFTSTLFKFYYMEDSDLNSGVSTVSVDSDALTRLQNSTRNVMIETLPTGRLGLPVVPHPVLPIGDAGIQILHPTILILTKIKRWSNIYDSTRPKTKLKARSDSSDIDYMLNWLAERKLVIVLEDYSGQPKENLLRALGILRNYLLAGGRSDVLELLRKVMQAADWVAINEEVPAGYITLC